MKHPFISLLLLLASANVYGQAERADSIELPDSEVHSPEVMHPTSLPGEMPWPAGGSSVAGPLPWMAPSVNSVGRMPEFKPEPIYPGRIAAWNGGELYGMTDSRSMPGLMGIEEGRIGVGQSVGRFSFTAYGEALKYAGFRSLTTSVGFGGSVSYTVNERVSLTLFGSYYTSPGRMSAAMAGYARISTFGGYVDYNFNDRWGIRTGAQAYRSSLDGRWQAQPIVMPYFRLSKKNIIGVDVGGILYQLLYNNRHNRLGRQPNPTIAPPVVRLSEMNGF